MTFKSAIAKSLLLLSIPALSYAADLRSITFKNNTTHPVSFYVNFGTCSSELFGATASGEERIIPHGNLSKACNGNKPNCKAIVMSNGSCAGSDDISYDKNPCDISAVIAIVDVRVSAKHGDSINDIHICEGKPYIGTNLDSGKYGLLQQIG